MSEPERRRGGSMRECLWVYLTLSVSNPDEKDFETSAEVSIADSFEKMNLKEDLVRGIYHYGTFH